MGPGPTCRAIAAGWLWLCASIVAATEGPSLAADVRALDLGDAAAPVFTVWGTSDGLSDEIWSTVGFDREGFVWAGSASALARFDGHRWTHRPDAPVRSLVRDMEEDASGRLWALFEREGLAVLEGGSFRLVPTELGFLHRFSSTQIGGEREIWVGHERGLARLVGDRWVEDPANARLPAGLVVATAHTQTLLGAPRQWIAISSSGLWWRTLGADGPGPWTHHDEPALANLQFTDLIRSIDAGREELWILTYGGGLWRLDARGLEDWRADQDLPTEAIYSARATRGPDGERLLWVASRAGLLRIRGDAVTVFDRRHGLPSDAVRGLEVRRSADGVDLLWLATEGGLARAALTDSPWRTVSLIGARENGIFAVLVEPDDAGGERLWVGTAKRGIAMLDREGWHHFRPEDGTLPPGGVRGIWRLPGPDGKPWRLVGLTGGALLRIDGSTRFEPLEAPWAQTEDEAPAIALARTSGGLRELWFGTLRSGVHRLREGRWTSFSLDDEAGAWTVLGLVEQIDAQGRSWLWAAGNQGVARFDGERWTAIQVGPAVPQDGYRTVQLVPRGAHTELWAGSNRHGVVRLVVDEPGRPRPVAADGVPPPPDPTVYSVLRDGAGHVYVCTNNGVQQLRPRADGGFDERVFRRRDGLVHDECNTNAQFVDAHGRFWAGTLGGLSVFDPALNAPPTATAPKPLVFTELRVDGRTRARPGGSAPLVLDAGTRELQVEFALLAGLRETESRYRSRLVGFDDARGEFGPERRRTFTALPPGRYRLEVEALDYAGTPARPISLEIEARPHWWQRESVIGVGIGLALLGVAGVVRQHNRNLRQRQHALEAEVAARTGQLHEANRRLTELSYVDPLTELANRRRLTEALDVSIARAATRRLSIGVIVADVDHFKAYNDTHGHIAGDAALRAVAQALASATREQDLVARYGGEEFACLLVDADADTVLRVAERMRALVEALPPRALGNDTHTLTLSAGVVTVVPLPDTRGEALLAAADSALYRAKALGRNRVECAVDVRL